ncbi:MAG: DNA-directed RNA polymerase subunit alpha [Dehalococcoidia bacterium]|nr:MAG: DNA-directed RNA polymerase subunit alpha [Dehalococcoidia bacterium]
MRADAALRPQAAEAPAFRPGGNALNELEPAHIEVEEETETYVRLVAEPLSAGFGTTLGNALRRVLLSSLPGAAVTSVRIEEVEHEFSTIPHMKEDTTEFLLNIKELRLRALADRPAKLYLEASGEGPVTAERIQTTADYEIVNPDLHLATLDAPGARLTVELNVEPGQGYAPAGQSDGLPIGVIPVDAIFSPVRRVNFHVTHTRVGQMTNYDKLTLEVWTDGTMSGVDAISKSADILVDELRMFALLGKPLPPTVDRGLGVGTSLPPDKYNMPIEDLNLSVRAYNCLKRSGLMTVGSVLEKSEDELLSLRNFGRKSYDELRDKLVELGLLPPAVEGIEPNGSVPIGRTPQPVEREEPEDLSPLGAALIEALREAGEDPSELIKRKERDE